MTDKKNSEDYITQENEDGTFDIVQIPESAMKEMNRRLRMTDDEFTQEIIDSIPKNHPMADFLKQSLTPNANPLQEKMIDN